MTTAIFRMKDLIKQNLPVKDGRGTVIGHTTKDSVPDPDYPGYFLTEVALHTSDLLIPKSGVYLIGCSAEPVKDIIGDALKEEEKLNELMARLLGYEVRKNEPLMPDLIFVYAPDDKTFTMNCIRWSPTLTAPLFPVWQPTRDAGQAWLIAEKLKLSVVRIENDKGFQGYMAGDLNDDSYISAEMGCVDGYMRDAATAQTMPLAICRAAEKSKQ